MRRIAFAIVLVAALVAPSTAAAVAIPAINPWRLVSEKGGKNLDQSSAVRAADGTLHVVYTDDESVSTSGIRYRTLSPGGTWSAAETVVAGWSGTTDPDIELIAGIPHVFFGGIRSTDTSDPASSGQAWYASRAGGTWSLSSTPLTALTTAYASSEFSTALAADGTLWGSWTGTFGLRVHTGLATGTEEPSLSGGCCDYASNLGRDAVTGDIYATYYSNADEGHGYFIQRVAPTRGDRVLLPGGRYGNDSLSRTKRMAAAARTTGGVYAAYCDRYPSCTGLRVGAVSGPNLRLRLPGSANAETLWTAAAPNGRLWVSWADSSGVWAARSNKALTQWGPLQLLKGPRSFDTAWQTSGNADRGTYDLFANFNVGDDFRTWHTRVRPKLQINPPILIARNNVARIVKLRLTDAGDPVGGTIRFRGTSKVVDATGFAQFVVPAGAMRGAIAATGSATGYVPAKSTVRITR
ncbi:MAG: hypothetical protein JWL76_819 [Thermoleophilia bacterium]|nr:hypothetical protein [Thermoleophilia bacterium]